VYTRKRWIVTGGLSGALHIRFESRCDQFTITTRQTEKPLQVVVCRVLFASGRLQNHGICCLISEVVPSLQTDRPVKMQCFLFEVRICMQLACLS